ncbi:glycosyltransferase [uncultured Catenibacterium sp.]|uniref:glycosyltransferase n=1 Tax=uncultured Catenibacterium sp. TaxID=286142 RepID=UPI0025D6CDB0|nr:glycosyltransferase [uncultured Catenibacterium sp.]
MRVLHLLQSSRFSGAENVVCQIIKMFENDKAITMAYCSRDGQIRSSLEEKNIEFYPIDDLNVAEVKRVINEYKPNIIHAHDMRASVIAAMAAKTGIKIISHIHNSDFQSRKLSIKSLLYYVFSWKYNKVIWVSNSCYNGYYYHKKLNSKSVIMYNTVNKEDILFKAKKDYDGPNYDVIYIGRLAEPKNPQRLMSIVKILTELYSDVHVAVVGQGNLEEETKDLAKKYNLQDNISFLGFMNNPLPILKHSKILVLTSDREGTPMVALEAMALNKPIVSTPTDGLCDLINIGKTGYLDNKNESFAKHLNELLTDDKKYHLFEKEVEKSFSEFNNENKYYRKLKILYEES